MNRPYRVLLIDDDSDFLEDSEIILESAGFETFTCSNPIKAQTKIKRRKPDIVLLDFDMPKRNGFGVLEKIRSNSGPPIPVIFLTAHKKKEIMIKGFQKGIDDFIEKPFLSEELILRIKAVMKRSDSSRAYEKRENLPKAVHNASSKNGNIFILQFTSFNKMRELAPETAFNYYEFVKNAVLDKIKRHFSETVSGSDSLYFFERRNGVSLIISVRPLKNSSFVRVKRIHKAANSLILAAILKKKMVLPDIFGGRREGKYPVFRIFDIGLKSGNPITVKELFEIMELDLSNPFTYEKTYRSIDL